MAVVSVGAAIRFDGEESSAKGGGASETGSVSGVGSAAGTFDATGPFSISTNFAGVGERFGTFRYTTAPKIAMPPADAMSMRNISRPNILYCPLLKENL